MAEVLGDWIMHHAGELGLTLFLMVWAGTISLTAVATRWVVRSEGREWWQTHLTEASRNEIAALKRELMSARGQARAALRRAEHAEGNIEVAVDALMRRPGGT